VSQSERTSTFNGFNDEHPDVVVAVPVAWVVRYRRRIRVSDAAILFTSVIASQLLWFSSFSSPVVVPNLRFEFAISYTVVSVLLAGAWMVALGAIGSRDNRNLGRGTTEYRKVIDATVRLFAVVAVIAYLFQIEFARGYILTALPFGLALLLIERWAWRQWLYRERAEGRFSDAALVVGSTAKVQSIVAQLQQHSEAGYRVVAVCLSGGAKGDVLPGTSLPVAGGLDDLLDVIDEIKIDTVIISGSDDLMPARIRELSWALEPGRQHLVMAPSLVDVGGPRIHTRPVAGLPLVHVETPRYAGATTFLKRALDLVMSIIAVILLSPVLIGIAIAIKVSSRGPVLFRQERVGLAGKRFTMLKFRSMVTDAEDRLTSLLDVDRSEGNRVMFKMKNDPRVTRVGRFLRSTSLDELPQLFNVIGGSMSIVGPRPPLQREVDLYDKHVHRRFLVKPGITGLWQVSGRSMLSWDESVRLDLYYVENWSLANDFVILLKTIRVVFARAGAY
jgi:exopolysaccharide biosynthesis polyprenyl glycosylphosphotransferase